MNSRLACVIVIAVFVSSVLVPAALSEDAAADPGTVNVNVIAYISAAPDIDDLGDVEILVDGNPIPRADITINDGKLLFTVRGEPGDKRIVAFRTYGYAVKEYILNVEDGGKEVLEIEIPAANANLPLIVFMYKATAAISGTLWWDGNKAGRDIVVEAYDPVRMILYTTKTDSNGLYVFKECPVGGKYIVSVNHPIREAPAKTVEELTEPVIGLDFTLKPKKGSTYLFDLDLTHSLMVIGGITGVFLLIFIMLYRIHIGRNPESSKIYSESKKKDQQ